jgi:hypothetical protein
MVEYLSKKDILVLIYPNEFMPEMMVIINPYDGQVKSFRVSSVEEIKQLLEQHLPWCSQGHPTTIHFGAAHVIEWEAIPASVIKIKTPEELEKLQG